MKLFGIFLVLLGLIYAPVVDAALFDAALFDTGHAGPAQTRGEAHVDFNAADSATTSHGQCHVSHFLCLASPSGEAGRISLGERLLPCRSEWAMGLCHQPPVPPPLA